MDQMIKGITKDGELLVVGLVSTRLVEKAKTLHDTFPTASAALGRVIGGALLLSSVLKDEQKVVIQVTGNGPLGALMAEADSQGNARGYVKHPHVHLTPRNGKLDVGGAVGEGFLSVIKDLGLRDYYRGSVPLRTGEIATDIAYYLNVSEQIPAVVSLGVFVETDNSVKAAGGFMMQALPGVREETLAHLEERLKEVRPVTSMILDGLGPKQILEEAGGLPVDILERKEVRFTCPCSRDRVINAIVALGRAEIRELIEKGETVDVQCQFCKTRYAITVKELTSLLVAISLPH